jgi:hypothetical protein
MSYDVSSTNINGMHIPVLETSLVVVTRMPQASERWFKNTRNTIGIWKKFMKSGTPVPYGGKAV